MRLFPVKATVMPEQTHRQLVWDIQTMFYEMNHALTHRDAPVDTSIPW